MYISAEKLRAAYGLKLDILAALGRPVAPGATVLDFGCGAGQAIRDLQGRGFDAYGFDIQEKWEPDTDASDLIEAGVIRVNSDEKSALPFPDNMFDAVFSYQVFEHVQDYDHSVSELARIMKPTGVSLHVFPARLRPIEAHVGVPFSSVVPEPWYLKLWASLGYAKPHQRKHSRAEIARRNHRFLTDKTHYIPGSEIKGHFQAHFQDFEFAEREFLCRSGRLGSLTPAVRALPVLPSLFGNFWTRVVMAGRPRKSDTPGDGQGR